MSRAQDSTARYVYSPFLIMCLVYNNTVIRCPGNVESYIPDVLQPLSLEKGSTGGGCASRDYTFTSARDRVEFSSQTVCTSHSLRPCQRWEELSDVAVAARGLSMYVKLLTDPYFQVSALESILSW